MNTLAPDQGRMTDDQLWKKSVDGDRDAFGQIVERHQALVCSLAYSACGSLSRSEDLAQETFLAAWNRLRDLREPAKLRAWLCGIVRHLAANAARRELRRGGPPESLDASDELCALAEDPAAQAVTREEAALLWQTLAALPETYREPMVLFYRQGQSVAEVARALELSEDAVRQRLTRGRAQLREELATLVEHTLTRTTPGAAFRMAVMVALPMATASTASAAVVSAKLAASDAGKGILAKIGLGVLIGPALGLTCAWIGTKAAASVARSGAERTYVLQRSRLIVAFCFVMSIGLAAVLSQAGKLYAPSALGIVLGVTVWTVALVGGILWECQRMDRVVERIRLETKTTDRDYAPILETRGKTLKLPRYYETKLRLVGLPLFAFAWGGYNADRVKSRAVCAWFAFGDIAISPLFAAGAMAIAPVAVGAITVGILSLSIFWGAALGVFALGSLAFGWWSVGCVAAGWKCALGFAAVAHNYALGFAATASEANTQTAKNWFRAQWWPDFTETMLQNAHWTLLTIAATAIACRIWKNRKAQKPA